MVFLHRPHGMAGAVPRRGVRRAVLAIAGAASTALTHVLVFAPLQAPSRCGSSCAFARAPAASDQTRHCCNLRQHRASSAIARGASSSSSQQRTVDDRIIILGAGLQGAALAYYLTLRGAKPTIVEREKVAAAASGKGGGFLARNWGNSITRQLHKVSFQLHEELAETLDIKSYRKLPVLSVQPGDRKPWTSDLCPWLDGDIADASLMDADGGAQVSPYELCTKLMDAAVSRGAKVVIGTAEGIETVPESAGLDRVVGVQVDGQLLEADKVCVCMGPWAALAQDWLRTPVPMTGIKSTSVVFKTDEPVEPFALFCGEDDRFGTHLEVYPRNTGEVYLCGIGGSQYIDDRMLRSGALPPGKVEADPARVDAAVASFTTMSRRFGQQPDTVQACMRPCLPDALPIMGKVGHVRGAYISAGHNCWGILWAPVSGLAMSELILDGYASCVNLARFKPGRFRAARAGNAGGRGRKMGDVPVGEQW